ncbi:hypothetical protein [Kitasatospora sp. NPDC057015]|uniref:hypothetical protein n=1 Tax=Kitasatospora sp. NPDC057015 TaxID=3346001 RepID=UPI00362F391A
MQMPQRSARSTPWFFSSFMEVAQVIMDRPTSDRSVGYWLGSASGMSQVAVDGGGGFAGGRVRVVQVTGDECGDRCEYRHREAREWAAAAAHLVDANAILDLVAVELGLAVESRQAPESLPAASELAVLPSIARAIAAVRARDTADAARTMYANALGAP